MRISALTALVVALVATPIVSADFSQAQGQSQSQPEQKPAPKPDAKAEPTLAGKWNMAIETQGVQRAATLDLKIDGKKVTGSIASEMGETPIAGELTDGKLAFSITFDMNGQSVSIAFAGTAQKDGSLAGTANLAGQEMGWTATRIKEK